MIRTVKQMKAGRWLSPDPAGWAAVDLTNPQSLNRYGYVLNGQVAQSSICRCAPFIAALSR
ncbi:MAG TPA: hypothetical protein VFI20_03000 [Terracidiphilus sp.]|nr:hypothetical protein [Terracidiphilus sp.]